MEFYGGQMPPHDLTVDEVFLVPNRSGVGSRLRVDMAPHDGTGATQPFVVANMTAVAGRRMAETTARRGGFTVLTQYPSVEGILGDVAYVQGCNSFYETPVTISPDTEYGNAADMILDRAHGVAFITEDGTDESEVLGVVSYKECLAENAGSVVKAARKLITMEIDHSVDPDLAAMYRWFGQNEVSATPVEVDGRVRILTADSVLHSRLFRPAEDSSGRLIVAAAVGVNNNPYARARAYKQAGVAAIVVDTAHGHQDQVLDVVAGVRQEVGDDVVIVAGNVVTAEGTLDLLSAGANIVKVGVGLGAMCTTREMTGVGRPQFSAVIECAAAAAGFSDDLGPRHVWADGGVRKPGDVAKYLGGGASMVMIGSKAAGRAESAAPRRRDDEGRPYREQYGMASHKAVHDRAVQEDGLTELDRAVRECFQEGDDGSRHYIDTNSPGFEPFLVQVRAGVSSAATYSAARTMPELRKRARFGIQSLAGKSEGESRLNGN